MSRSCIRIALQELIITTCKTVQYCVGVLMTYMSDFANMLMRQIPSERHTQVATRGDIWQDGGIKVVIDFKCGRPTIPTCKTLHCLMDICSCQSEAQ